MILPKHDGCAYMVAEKCRRRNCKPAEKCPGGVTVYRDKYQGGHHHAEDEK